MAKKWEKGRFQYVITTDNYFYPRKLADGLSYSPDFPHMVSIRDLQNDNHIYGDTYEIPHGDE
jgi:hypothetical protein